VSKETYYSVKRDLRNQRLVQREKILCVLGSEFNRTLSNNCGHPIVCTAKTRQHFRNPGFVANEAIHTRKEVYYFWKHQTSNYLRIQFPSAKETYDGLSILEYRACRGFPQDTPFPLWTHPFHFGHTLSTLDTPFPLWTHPFHFGHTLSTLCLGTYGARVACL